MAGYRFYHPTEILFGAGRLNELGGRAARFGKVCLLVTAPKDEEAMRPLYERVKDILVKSGVEVHHCDKVVPNPTIENAESAIRLAESAGAEMVVAVGGGSAMDAAKAAALFYRAGKVDWHRAFSDYGSAFSAYPPVSPHSLPVIAVPTTAGTGSEMTQAMIISDPLEEEKACIFHPDAFPKIALVDPELTLTMPRGLTAATGFDAFCHAFESLMREEASPHTKMFSLGAIQDIARALPRLMRNPKDLALRETMSRAAMWAGISLSNATAAIPHPLSEIIGGIAPRVAHGQALAALYPAFVRFQITKTPEKCAAAARAMNESLARETDAKAAAMLPEILDKLLQDIGLDKKLGELGVTQEEKEKMCGHFLLGVLPFGTREELTAIMREAF